MLILLIVSVLLCQTVYSFALPSETTPLFSSGLDGGAAEVHYLSPQTCDELCTNRYGYPVCCSQPNNGLTCPPAPRFNIDCNDVNIMKQVVPVQHCRKDSDCGKTERCCQDTCDVAHRICMPGDRNIHYLFP